MEFCFKVNDGSGNFDAITVETPVEDWKSIYPTDSWWAMNSVKVGADGVMA